MTTSRFKRNREGYGLFHLLTIHILFHLLTIQILLHRFTAHFCFSLICSLSWWTCNDEHVFLCISVFGFPSDFTIGSILIDIIFLSKRCWIVNFEKYLVKKITSPRKLMVLGFRQFVCQGLGEIVTLSHNMFLPLAFMSFEHRWLMKAFHILDRSFPGTPCLHNSLLSLEYFIESHVFSSNLVHLK